MDKLEEIYKDVPKELKDLRQWLCYDDRDKEEYKDASEDFINQDKKCPRDLLGKIHGINSRLFTFEECLNSIREGYNTGLGIVLKSGLVCLDYDKCIKNIEQADYDLDITFTDKDTESRIMRDIDLLHSYTEVSPSGKGLHIYCIGNISINTNKQEIKGIEIYSNKFMRVSGKSYMYLGLEEDTEQLLQIIDLYKLKEQNKATIGKIKKKDNIYKEYWLRDFKFSNRFTDKQILDTMFNSKKGYYLKKLYNNELSDEEYLKFKGKTKKRYFKKDLKISTKDLKNLNRDSVDVSNSGKAFTLIMYLYDFSYGDIKAVYRLFKKSPLCKDDYLIKKYASGTEDKITNQFIPKVLIYYKNFRYKIRH